jgi:XTP/dITP diphosphohydrolase
MRQIIAATGNAHKVEEMQAILAPLGIEVLSAKTAGGMPEVVEDGDTFAANAVKKAVETAQALQRTVLADDSGLEVFSLGGKPGIYSARYACEGGNDGRNVRKLLGKLDGSDDRAAAGSSTSRAATTVSATIPSSCRTATSRPLPSCPAR